MTPDAFTVPATIAEAEQLHGELVKKERAIAAELADGNRTDASGRRLTPAEYRAWRAGAVQAHRQTVARIRAVKEHLTRLREERGGREHDA